MDVGSPPHPSLSGGIPAGVSSPSVGGGIRPANSGSVASPAPTSPVGPPPTGGMAVFTPNSMSISSQAAATAALNASLSTLAMRREVSESAFEYLLAEILNMALPNAPEDEQDRQQALQQRLDGLGYEVGYRYIERISQQRPLAHLMASATAQPPSGPAVGSAPSAVPAGGDPLEVVKFVCKEFWEEVFRKKVDKLQTNHRGVFVLTDLKFKWLDRYSLSDDMASKQNAALMLHFPCGILRGALANLGILSIVVAEFNALPACTFNIKIKTS